MAGDSNIVDWPDTLPGRMRNEEEVVSPRHVSTLMESGRIRNRRTETNSLRTIQASWNFTKDQFEIFKEFFDQTLLNGSLPFEDITEKTGPYPECPLFLIEVVAFFPPTYTFVKSDNLFAVRATLELIERERIPTPGPTVPSGYTLDHPSFGDILLEWSVDDDTLQTVVERNSDDVGWEELATIDTQGPGSFSYEDQPEPGQNHCYRIKAINRCGESEYSSTLCYDLPADDPPATPTLSLEMVFPDVELSWTVSPGALTYELQRSANDSGTWSAVTTTTDPDVEHTDSPATDTDWSYRVRAVNSFGNSDWSNIVVADLSTLVRLSADDLSIGSVTTWPDQGPRDVLVYQPNPGFVPSCVADFDDGGHNAVRFFVQSTYIDNPPTALVMAPAHLVFSDLSGDLDAGLTVFFVGVDDVGQQARPWLVLGEGGGNEIEIRGTYTDLVNDFGGVIAAKKGGASSVNEGFTTMGQRLTVWTVRISNSGVTWWEGSSTAGTGSSSGLLDAIRSANLLMAKDDFDAHQMSEAHLHHLLIKNRAMSDTEVQTMIYALASQYGVSL